MNIRAVFPSQLAPVLDELLSLCASAPTAPHWTRAAWLSAFAGDRTRILLLATAGSSAVPLARTAAPHLKDPDGDPSILGFAVASLTPPEAELESIVVAPAFQRHGVGRTLLAELFARLTAAQITTIHLELRASNQAAIALYRQSGFLSCGQRPHYYEDPVEDALLLSRRLR